ncbi:LysR substrate-binding domain-containing protein [Paraburkholderia sp. SIMBA_055]
MADCLQANPGIALRLITTTTMVDLDLDGVDLVVRHSDGADARLSVQLLCHDEFRAYCSPVYAKKNRLKRRDDLLTATLLHSTLHPHWTAWLARFSSLNDSQSEAIRGIQLDQSLMAIDAAVRAQGVVLTSPLLVEAELASGELIDPIHLFASIGRGLLSGPSCRY